TSALNAQISSLRSQNSQLNAELNAANGTGPSTGSQTGTNTIPSPSAAVTSSPSPSSSSSTLGPNGTTYQVKPGDSLSAIEERFYKTIGLPYTQAIEQANGLANSAIHAGQTLTIPPLSAINTGGTGATTTSPTPPVTATTPAATHPSPSSTKR
ncbi:MAG TPA: LysM peptidoglycan-binding domain-containing protein, partial [Actinomycetota bacterium]|nr:LysM peptidoglycan-binding domain-containing protein [Actinomycetota bacterium]